MIIKSEAKAEFICGDCDIISYIIMQSETNNLKDAGNIELYCPSCGAEVHSGCIKARQVDPPEQLSLELYDEWIILNKEATIVDTKHD